MPDDGTAQRDRFRRGLALNRGEDLTKHVASRDGEAGADLTEHYPAVIRCRLLSVPVHMRNRKVNSDVGHVAVG